MRRTIATAWLIWVIVLPLLNQLNADARIGSGENFCMQVRSAIEERIAAPRRADTFTCRGESLSAVQLIPAFYMQRGFAPAWFDSRGLLPPVYNVLEAISQADQDGLQPSDYHLETIETTLAELGGPPFPPSADQATIWAAFDLLVTDAFLLLGSHLSNGRLNPETLHKDWLTSEKSVDLLADLQGAVSRNHIHEALQKIRPSHSGYHMLVKARKRLQRLKEIGGWPRLPDGATLNPGDQSERIPALRHRLIVGGDLAAGTRPENPQLYDENLAGAVMFFQKRHGLTPDALIGPRTLTALNQSVEDCIRRVDINLERWRWLQDELGDHHIFINIANFNLQVVEGGRPVMDIRVVVGRPMRRTPVFSSKMTYLVLNPYWNVPQTIAVEDMLPKIIDNTDYLDEQGITVFSGWDENARVIDPDSVDWSLFGKSKFPFRLRQDPGPLNALGRIKFMFPNKFAVYLHDTPQRSHFRELERDFSSGCIRVEKVIDLAAYLLQNNPRWTREKITIALDQGMHQVLVMSQPIPVHLVYMTAWLDNTGILQFRRDIYGRDVILERALASRN